MMNDDFLITKPNNETGYETERGGAQYNYDQFSTIYSELLQLEKDIRAMDDKLSLLFGDNKRKKYDLKPCANRISRIFYTVDDDAMPLPQAKGIRLMTRAEQYHLF